ncbi:hypothetical protein SBA2_680031 [Acidobacteriia bacterium SbA2]|nr:hypothetical protein SBA2_680031 [Acidobacteriia bacterium SbA2]
MALWKSGASQAAEKLSNTVILSEAKNLGSCIFSELRGSFLRFTQDRLRCMRPSSGPGGAAGLPSRPRHASRGTAAPHSPKRRLHADNYRHHACATHGFLLHRF